MKIRFLLFLTIFCAFVTKTWGQTQDSAAGAGTPSYKLVGEAELNSHFVFHGLSQTNKDPSLHGSFWFNFGPQFRLGVWGSNTNYEGSDIHLWLKFNADVKVNFSQNAGLIIRYSQNQFYKSDSRNGNTVALDLDLYTYHVIYELESNWDGTSTSSTYYAFQKTYDIFTNWKWGNQIGYSMVKATGYSNYFDFRTGLGTKISDVFAEAYVTGTSAASQFNGRGDFFIVGSIQAKF